MEHECPSQSSLCSYCYRGSQDNQGCFGYFKHNPPHRSLLLFLPLAIYFYQGFPPKPALSKHLLKHPRVLLQCSRWIRYTGFSIHLNSGCINPAHRSESLLTLCTEGETRCCLPQPLAQAAAIYKRTQRLFLLKRLQGRSKWHSFWNAAGFLIPFKIIFQGELRDASNKWK